MSFYHYTNGGTYSPDRIDTSLEIIPENRTFATREGEFHIFDYVEGDVSQDDITQAMERGEIGNYDKKVLSMTAIFGNAACTSKTLFEMLTLMGVETSRQRLEGSLKRLAKYNLIAFSRFGYPTGKRTNTRIITLTKYGKFFAESIGVQISGFSPQAARKAKAWEIKTKAETTQLVCNWLKNLQTEQFRIRPMRFNREVHGAVVRPNAVIDIWGESVYFEIIRRHDDFINDLTDKLLRYELVFGKDTMPTIILNGEDEGMNFEIYSALLNDERTAYMLESILFTDDIATFGTNFKHSLYTFGKDGKLLRYAIKDLA